MPRRGNGKAQEKLRRAHLAVIVAETEALLQAESDAADEEEAAIVQARVVTRKLQLPQKIGELIAAMQQYGVPETTREQPPSDEHLLLGYYSPGRPCRMLLGDHAPLLQANLAPVLPLPKVCVATGFPAAGWGWQGVWIQLADLCGKPQS